MAKRKLQEERDEKNIYGQWIKQRRMELKLTQVQFAARMDLQGVLWDQKIVSRVELQERSVTDYELQAAANALDTTLEQLMHGKKKENKSQ